LTRILLNIFKRSSNGITFRETYETIFMLVCLILS